MAIFQKSQQVNNRRQEVVAKIFTTAPNATSTVVTQVTNRSTGVTLNTTAGQITTSAASLAAGAEAKFVVTNNKVTASSVPVIAIASGQTADTSVADVVAIADGSFTIQLTNLNAATADTGASVINFVILGVE